jgi:hypothetical protein
VGLILPRKLFFKRLLICLVLNVIALFCTLSEDLLFRGINALEYDLSCDAALDTRDGINVRDAIAQKCG